MDAEQRAALRRALEQHYPWVTDTDHGPAAVEAGDCDGCGLEARLLLTCGPGPELFLGRACARDRGVSAWCDGHEPEAAAALSWVAGLPAEADVVARLWWVATGEVSMDPDLVLAMRRQLPTG
jgi:hypothetical protein